MIGVAAFSAMSISPLVAQTCHPIVIIPLTFTDSAPAFGESSATLTFQWTAVTDASCDGPCSYDVIATTSTGYCSPPVATPVINDFVSNGSAASTLTYTATLSVSEVVYWFRVLLSSQQEVGACREEFNLWDTFTQPPAKPALISGTPSPAGAVTLTFSYPDERAGVLEIERANTLGGPFEVLPDASVSYCPPDSRKTFVDYGLGGSAAAGGKLAPGTYYYRLAAFNFGGGTNLSAIETDSDVVKVVVPNPCAELSAPVVQANGGSTVSVNAGDSFTLTWNSVAGANTYQVWKSKDASPFAALEAAQSNQTSFTVTTGASDAGHSFAYFVRAKASCGSSVDSALVTVSVACAVESTPQITSPGGGTFGAGDTYVLTWSGSTPAPAGYRIQIQRGAAPPVDLATVTTTSYSYVVQASDSGTLTFTVQAQSACGVAGNSPFSAPANISVGCSVAAPPAKPGNLRLTDSHGGPVTGTSYLHLSWDAVPQPVSSYHWMINGGQEGDVDGSVVSPAADANPVGLTGAITLSVKATDCAGDSPTATQDAPNTPPVANFTVVSVDGLTATFMDTSSDASTDMQPTAWLWLFGDGDPPDDKQAPTPHTYRTAGAYAVWLIASNGAGSNVTSNVVTVGLPASPAVAFDEVARFFDSSNPERLKLDSIEIGGVAQCWLHVATQEPVETIVFLRFLDSSGALVKERRLSIRPGQDGQFDLRAYGLVGTFRLEVVSLQKFSASVVERIPSRDPVELPRRHGPPRLEDRREQ